MKIEIPDELLNDYEIVNETTFTNLNGVSLGRKRELIERSILNHARAEAHLAFGEPISTGESENGN